MQSSHVQRHVLSHVLSHVQRAYLWVHAVCAVLQGELQCTRVRSGVTFIMSSKTIVNLPQVCLRQIDSTTILPRFYHDSTTIQPRFNPDSTPIRFNPDSTPIQPRFNPDSTPIQPRFNPDSTPIQPL